MDRRKQIEADVERFLIAMGMDADVTAITAIASAIMAGDTKCLINRII